MQYCYDFLILMSGKNTCTSKVPDLHIHIRQLRIMKKQCIDNLSFEFTN